MKTISQLMEQMIVFSNGNLHDITHFITVWTYAKTIGELEGLDADTQYLLEATAIVHDIACPFCREKYGRADGKLQEKEGPSIVRTFLADSGMTEARVDYLVNASEKTYIPANVQNFMNTSMKTESGKKLAKALFCL